MDEIEPIWIDWPHARIRPVITSNEGAITRFVVQLEHDVANATAADAEPDWQVAARFDHDSTSEGGHDVTEEGLHLDVYRGGQRHERLRDFPRLRPGVAMRYSEEYLMGHGDRSLARFERWHGPPSRQDRG